MSSFPDKVYLPQYPSADFELSSSFEFFSISFQIERPQVGRRILRQVYELVLSKALLTAEPSA